jgi:hypothetical protein
MRQCAKVRRVDTQLVFPSPNGKKPIAIRSPWETALRRAGIEDFRFHDLRHSAASYLAMNGVSLMEIADILGHKTLAMVKRYTYLSDTHTRNVVAWMNRGIFMPMGRQDIPSVPLLSTAPQRKVSIFLPLTGAADEPYNGHQLAVRSTKNGQL